MELLDELRLDGLALLFITHNLALVRSVATSALVLEHGHVRELGDAGHVIDHAEHPYTQALLAAAPDLA
jgi:peptide/nickel transport system ATP-binding protein